MVDRFVVCKDWPTADFWIVYVTGEQLPNSDNFDPRGREGLVIISEMEVDSEKSSEDRTNLATLQFLARLDVGTHTDRFRRALALAFKMGMAAQREIDLKRAVETSGVGEMLKEGRLK